MNKLNIRNNGGFALLSVCIGTATSLIVTLLISLTTSICIFKEYVQLESADYIIPIGYILAAFAGVVVTGRIAKDNKLIACYTGGLYYLIMIAVDMLVLDGIDSSAIWSLLCCAAGCAAAIFLNFRINHKSAVKKRRRRSR